MMKKMIFLLVSFIIGLLVFKKNDSIIIPSDAIRVRIIANSNSIKDLYEKKKIKEELKDDLYQLLSDSNSSLDAKKKITNNMNKIREVIEQKTSNYQIKFGKNYFPKKIYRGVIYNEGEYDSLVITLGKGLGENWWCVLYPPLCMIDDNNITSDVEYHSLIMDLIHQK